MTIELMGIEVHGCHGVLPEERASGQRFLVDLQLELAQARAAETDSIADTVDYRAVVELVREISAGRTFDLLEAFSSALADALVAAFPLSWVRVRVRKPDVVLALPLEHAAVIVERSAPG